MTRQNIPFSRIGGEEMKKIFQRSMGLLILAILVLTAYNFNVVRNEMLENRYNALINDLRTDSATFGLWIKEKKSIVNTAKDIYDNFSYEELVAYNTENPYLNINNEDPSISQLYIGLADGHFITGGQWIPPEDYDPRTRTWYLEAQEAGKTIVSSVYVDRETGEMLVTISSPLYLRERFIGVISADVFLESIRGFLMTEMEKRNSYSMLVDEDGTMVIHTHRPNLEGQNIYTDLGSSLFKDYFNEAKQSQDIVRMAYAYEGEDILGIVQKADGRNWYLAVARVDDVTLWNAQLGYPWIFFVNALMLTVIVVLMGMILKARSELHSMNTLLTKENEKDFLTGIYNRRYLNLYLESVWRQQRVEALSLLILDVDFFKNYNDTYGHIQGDEVLKNLTKCINNLVRKKDVFARFGGEEFALVLEDVEGPEVEKIAQKSIDAVYHLAMKHETSPFKRVTISIGVVTVAPGKQISVREAIEYADKALYEAKESGRNKVVFHEGKG
ncbi:diguanylate cyclase (GGDEF) domain-containing protein [Tindallia californiensis]|uniref:Diguanylate cyclase (GGDEF) domain-containing protein n=2 Tax=Tindallia californiensis TaxID=159292 RepID=A0A1H3R4N0_9FIRM|nr:diguanylate cyclase (GGDEF) domain-containing protein [Tindallia californiensis]